MATYELFDPRAVERGNQNALRKFPFSDAATCGNGACVIPPGAIVDAQLYVPGREPGRVWLSSVGPEGRLHFSDADGEFAETSSPPTPDTAVPVVFTGDGGPCPGGVVVFGKPADAAALAALAGQAFGAEEGELAPAAVAWPGLPGVRGFRLDDGHVLYGDVKIRGANGCSVATYEKDGTGYLRISAIGRTVTAADATTGFITRAVVSSDNTHFVVAPREIAEGVYVRNVVDVLATGAAMTTDDALPADQEDLCAAVRKTLGTVLSASAGASGADSSQCDPCKTPSPRTITLKSGATVMGTVPVMDGEELAPLAASQLGVPPSADQRFDGYFSEAGGRGTLYYRYDGTPAVHRFTAGADVVLHAHFMAASSSVEVSFAGYGTLHLAEADAAVSGFLNPVRISGLASPVPSVKEIPGDVLAAGGMDALAQLVLHPAVPSGEVHIGLRGLGKAVSL